MFLSTSNQWVRHDDYSSLLYTVSTIKCHDLDVFKRRFKHLTFLQIRDIHSIRTTDDSKTVVLLLK